MNTTDNFTEDARAEAFRAWFEEPTTLDTISELGAHMAEWARDHLAQQEPNDAEVLDHIEDRLHDAGVTGIAETSDGEIVTTVDAAMAEVLTAARAALSEARAARRDEEDRA